MDRAQLLRTACGRSVHAPADGALGERSGAARGETVRASMRPDAPRCAPMRPAALTRSQLARFLGTDEGGQYVTVAHGALVYQTRVAQPRVTLVSLGADTFASGSARYVFEGTGGTMQLRIVSADGSATSYPRTSVTVPPRRR